MSINFNGQGFERLPAMLAAVQRGLFYGDALFETLRVFGGRLPLLGEHWARLSQGLKTMGYVFPSDWSAIYFENQILQVAPANARVRLTVWRSPGGLLVPENNVPQFLITAQALESSQFEWFAPGLEIGCCKSVRLPVDDFSSFKTLNAARYVVAAQEAQVRGWDDGLLLNAFERVCEATSSNVFWFEGNTLCTIPLTEGCVTGTLRKILLGIARASGLPVEEKPATFATLLAADEAIPEQRRQGYSLGAEM